MPKLFILSGPSGVGKDSVRDLLMAWGVPLYFVVTATDRAPREGEVEGVHYRFLTPAEFDRFQELNTAYRAKFGFPFIMAVRGKTRPEILAAFERRIHNDPEAEFRTALDEVHKIALLRLGDL